MKIPSFAVAAALLFVVACGSSDDSSGSGGSGGSAGSAGSSGAGGATNVPADNASATISSFIANKGFEGSGWSSETSSPRDPSSQVSPHGRVRVYLSDQAVQAQAGQTNPLDIEYGAGAMAVKEMYENDAVVGYAVMFKHADGQTSDAWTDWCYAPDGRCGVAADTPNDAIYGSPATDCSGCHGSVIFTLIP